MTDVVCFVIEQTTRYEVYARRYTDTTKHPDRAGCERYGHHSAMLLQAKIDLYQGESLPMLPEVPSGPPSEQEKGVFTWPGQCERCSYVFQSDDVYQRFLEPVYTRGGSREEHGLRDWPPGAMWRAPWFEKSEVWRGPDGESWVVRLPVPDMCWDWPIDGPSSSGGGWTRSGTAPHFTVTPSIGAGTYYHGWLRDGVLTEA